MRNDYTREYMELLEDTLDLINQKQAKTDRLSELEGYDRKTCLTKISRLDELIKHKRVRMEELKKQQ